MAKIQTLLHNPAAALLESARASIVMGCAAALALAGTTLPF